MFFSNIFAHNMKDWHFTQASVALFEKLDYNL